ncbi:MAG TPA: DUF72 domain-containing protein [Opitutaceae bacterium]|nr:DUF72 domain-containing protein [Opitutaceae bacterium]
MTASSSASSKLPRAPRVSVGIGSWTDKEYTPLVFPKGVKSDERLKIYATRFDHVEVNAGYHVIPPRDRVANWVAQTPPGFVFDFKLHRDFSESPEISARNAGLIAQLLRSAEPMAEAGKLGAFFLILPASFTPTQHRLEAIDPLIEKLRPHLLALELRHRAWVEGEERARTFDFYRARGLVWVAVDMPRIADSTMLPPIDEVTNPQLAYLRLHGRRPDWFQLKEQKQRHAYEYSAAELDEIAARVRTLAAKAEVVHVVANNHAQDFAPKTALALQKLLGVARPKIETTGELFPTM